MGEFLSFPDISSRVKFKDFLDWQNIPYTITQQGEIRGEGFIVTISKNQYFDPKTPNKIGGSVINFLANRKGVDLRTAAKEIKDHFLVAPKEPKREIPNLELHYCKFLEDRGISQELAKELEIGLVKQHSIIAGKLAFKTYDENGNHSGYVGYNISKDEWFFPKGFKRTLYNPKKLDSGGVILTVDLFTCLSLIARDNPAVSLIGKTMTDIQAEQLSKFENILVVHPEPDNIIVRLSKVCYVKCST